MKELKIREAKKEDIETLVSLIKGLASYEKRPQDMKATKKQLTDWLFEKNIATALFAEFDGLVIGYAIYYPIFGSFSAIGRVYLEDLFILEEYRGRGFGKVFFNKILNRIIEDGYEGLELSCLDWNKPSIGFYEKLSGKQIVGRKYFEFDKDSLK